MSIAVIAATHKESAEALLESVEMICGKQENVKAVSFYENEDAQMLKHKYENMMQELNTENGVLFLVDLFGGTPFNAAYMVSQEQENVQIITGINLPMFIEALMSKDVMNLEELVKEVKKAGIEGIKEVRIQESQDEDE